MSEKPILFSGPMILALLDGRKNQTRRIVKPTKHPDLGCEMAPCEIAGDVHGGDFRCCPYPIGTRLWVRESLKSSVLWDGKPRAAYAADDAWCWDLYNPCEWIWKRPTLPSIHMPRGLSRLTLEVTDVRVQRVQEISEDDAWAEGPSDFLGPLDIDGRLLFKDLWDRINAKRGYVWEANPYVWAYTFRIEVSR